MLQDGGIVFSIDEPGSRTQRDDEVKGRTEEILFRLVMLRRAKPEPREAPGVYLRILSIANYVGLAYG